MSQMIKCDLCDKVVDEFTAWKENWYSVLINKMDKWQPAVSYHFCKECSERADPLMMYKMSYDHTGIFEDKE